MIAGFDVLGFALEAPGDTVTVTAQSDGPGGVHMGNVSFSDEVPNGQELQKKLSRDVEHNIAGYVVREIWQAAAPGDRPHAMRVDLQKGCGIGTGLGSSAASAAAAAFAGLSLLGQPNRASLLDFGLRGEALASGARHADNLAPSLLGGIVGVRSVEPIDVYSIPTPTGLCCAVFQPDVTVLTREARCAIPPQVSLADYVYQSAQLASLVAGLYSGDLERIADSLSDLIAEPYRAQNIPAFAELRADALNAGAFGAGIAGSGPTMFALCADTNTSEQTLEAWGARYQELGVGFRGFQSVISQEGARLL